MGANNASYILDLLDASVVGLVDENGNALIIDGTGVHFVTANCTFEVDVPFANSTASNASTAASSARRSLALERRGLAPCEDSVDAGLTAFSTACQAWEAMFADYGTVATCIPSVSAALETTVLGGPVIAGIFGAFWGVAIAMTAMCRGGQLLKIEAQPFGVDPAQWYVRPRWRALAAANISFRYACHVCQPHHGGDCP